MIEPEILVWTKNKKKTNSYLIPRSKKYPLPNSKTSEQLKQKTCRRRRAQTLKWPMLDGERVLLFRPAPLPPRLVLLVQVWQLFSSSAQTTSNSLPLSTASSISHLQANILKSI